MNLLLCFGTRPEAIKMAPIIHELQKRTIPFKVCVTAQHREMLDQVLDFFEIKPDYDLDLMKAGQSLNRLTAAIFNEIDEVLKLEQPDLVLIHGDTTTASMIALAAFHKQIKVGHVEAGLRTYNKEAPFPEEINRQIIGRIADFHFAPTAKAKLNLLNEQIPHEQIVITGNTVVDSLNWADKKINDLPLSIEIERLNNLLNTHQKLILVTGHRRENFGRGLENICEALLEISLDKQIEIIYPIHLNPNVTGPVKKLLSHKNNIHLIEPVAYPTILWLMKQCCLIISDSGGIQEEAPTFNKPVLVTRDVTERMEGVDAGFSFLVGTNKTRILEVTKQLINYPTNFKDKKNPYGDGKAASIIVDFLKGISNDFKSKLE